MIRHGSLLLAAACLWSTVRAADTPLPAPASLPASAALSASAAPALAAKLPPLKAFFQNSDVGEVRLSPSGRWLAVATGARTGRVVLAVIDLQGAAATSSVVANFEAADVRSFEWVNDERLVFNLIDLQTGIGAQGFGPGLYSVRRDGTEMRLLIRPHRDFVREIRMAGVQPLDGKHGLLSVPRTGGDEVIVGEYGYNNRGEEESVSPKRLNVVTGRTSALIGERPDHVFQWLFDPAGEPRVAITLERGQEEIFWRAPGQSAWRSIARFPSLAARQMQPLLVDGDGQLFVSVSMGEGAAVLKRFDFAANAPEAGALVSTPGFDFAGQLISDWGGHRTMGVRVSTDAESTVWFDAGMKKLQALADQRFPGRINHLTCRRCVTDGALLVYSYSDQDPGRYWLYRSVPDTWEPIAAVRREIDPKQMAQLDLHRIRARDGQDLPVWVTMPRKATGAQAGPAVVLVHGGPWVRGGHWRWSADAQFLASRGYVVIEPEFRGSTGYGWEHFHSGWKHWGTTMQDDVADALQWAADKKLVDPKRVCIAGASYGGYSTLMSLVRYPDMYRCGVAWVAVTDPRLLFQDAWSSDSHKESRDFTMPELIGDPVKDADMLKAAAPVERAGEIKVPVLLAFGGADRRVPLEHGTRMRAAMHETGHDPEWVVYNDEGHGWLKVSNKVDFWERVERFLDQQLKERAPAR